MPGNIRVIAKEDFSIENTKDIDLLVFSGGSDVPTVLHHPDVYQKEIEVVKKFNGSILGICLGCEIIAEAFGGGLIELSQDHRGEVEIVFGDIKAKPFEKLTVNEAHRVGIVTMPNDFEIIAYSDHSPEIIKHRSKSILGLQFHPEMTRNTDLDNWILNTLIG